MHGREDGETRKRIRHMWSVASRSSSATAGVDSGSSSPNSFLKDGRKITVGDCALFKPPNDYPPFIGIINSLSLDKDSNLKLGVNWLYRPSEVVLGKGVALEAAPNEIFYSFHRDETPAASLLHPCKVAFLPKGVELPSGVSSFVCRRVYDITNNCLWWLTDKDYINDRQEEVDQLLQKPHLEMHGTVQQQGTNSPKSVNGTAATSPLKHSPDNMQNSNTYASDPKGKKRELGDQTSETMKRERLMKDGDSVLSRSESILKSEISKISDKGRLVDYESVEKLVQLMQAEKSQKKADLSCRSMLVGIVASTDRFDCLNQFVQLRGLPVLDEWLQEVHKGKVGDSGSPKDGDKSVEDFLFVLLRALDRLPVNLNDLRMCNIGKSVNNLRSHKNLEIQKKSRSLVDAWKKRIELELDINDSKPGSNQPVPFVCRRVYDITNNCLWWLTDKDYINDRQEEVDQLLQKPHLEMHGTVQQQGTNSPKSVNAATSPLKHSPDSMQNSNTYASHPKGKKRELGDLTSESVKRERLMKDAGDSVLSRSESILKSEISKITDKGGLVDYESVEKLVQLMQAEKSQKKADLSCRSMLVGIVASTDKFDCLNQFVQLRGLPILDEWLQEVHKGKVGDSGSPKDGDKSVEDFLFVLLRALDKLPVNLNVLQMCNIGKSVNNLRSHKNLEIQKKSRSLVDTWKKRVELELNINDSKPGSNQPVPWSGRSRHDASHGVNKHPSGSSDTAMRSSGHFGSAKSGATIRTASVPSGSQKITASMPLVSANSKDGQVRILSAGGGSELLHTAVKEEKSSSSSQSHNNSQCSSDHARNIARSGKEDARSSTAGSKSMNKTAGSSRHRKSANGPQVTAHSGLQKELGFSWNSSPLPNVSPSEKVSESTITSENNVSTPAAESNSHKIIVKLPNRGRSPGRIAKTASTEDPSCRNSRASSPANPEKLDQADAGLREKNNALQTNESDVTPAVPPDGRQYTSGNDVANGTDVSKGGLQCTEKDVDRPIDSSMSSMNALLESCVKYSEAHVPISVGDDSGMNLLASVATGEITRSGASSPGGSPPRNTAMTDNASVDNEGATLCNDGAPSRPSVSSDDPVQNVKLDELAGGTSASTACIVSKSDEGGDGQILVKAAVMKDESHDSVSCTKQIANSHSPTQVGYKDIVRSAEGLDKDPEDLPTQDRGLNTNVSVEHQPTSLATHPVSATKLEGQVGDCSTVREELVLEHRAKQITEIIHKGESSSVPDGVNKRNKQENNASLNPLREEGFALASAACEEKSECKEREMEPCLNSNKSAATTVKGERKDECGSCTANASSSATVISDTERKLEFDLNEGFNMDDMKNGEPTNMVSTVFPTPVSLFGSSQSAVSASSGLPASVTVASAAKRPFVPPEDLLKYKSELGWKGSAATSAFRPAEPRKVLENQPVSNRAALKEPIASKPGRPFLDIDLNVTDEMDLLDMGCENSANAIDHNLDCKGGGFELDLNKIDDSPELGHRSAVNLQRLEVSVPPLQSSNSMVNGDINNKRNFDLNDGPAGDESTVESSLFNPHARGNIPPQPTFGLRMNNATVGSLSSWYSPGTTYSAVTTPVQLPDISILGAPGTHRVIGAPTTASQFNTDFYRGSVLSSSPAAPFPTAPFQYPVFPFGTSFPFPTSSLSGGAAAYMDPSSGGRFCTPAVPTQLLGTAGAVSSQYLRPCVASLPDVSSNVVVESSQKWGRLGLDLNSGPASVDAEGKDEALLIASRQHSAFNSQVLMDEQARGYQVAGGVLKRKDPEGSWGTDRFSYKQPSWQ